MKQSTELIRLRSVIYLKPVLLMVFGLMLFLLSCDIGELPDNDKPVGKWMPVSVTILGISSGNVEDVTRSAAAFEPVTETVFLGDGLLMEMSLEADPAAELRADSFPLANGVKFLLIAVKADDGKYVSHAEYTIIGGVPTLDSPDDSVHVRANGNYKFMCVSFNNSTSPASYAGTTLDEDNVPTFPDLPNDVDLLYWSHTVNNVTERQVLPVTFRHQFNSVKVKVDCSFNNWNITNIAANSIQFNTRSAFQLTPATDITPAGSAVTKSVTWPSSFTADPLQESRGDTVYLSKLDIQLAKDALTLSIGSTTPSAAYTFTFSSASFTAGGGKSYVLTLKVKQPMFASSNIYWDGSRLTFGAYREKPDTVPAYKYQGVYFKFGSLVGISPKDDWSDDTTILYVPRVGTVPKDTFYVSTANNPDIPHTDQWSGTDYGAIPFVEDGSENGNRNNRHVIDIGISQSAQMKGDICQYLEYTGAAPATPAGFHWSLPTSTEFGNNTGDWDSGTVPGWTKVGAFEEYVPSSAAGTDIIPSGGNFGATANFFPVSGYRNTGGSLSSTGNYGSYWSGSANSPSYGYSPVFFSNAVITTYSNSRQYGRSVRCVLRE